MKSKILSALLFLFCLFTLVLLPLKLMAAENVTMAWEHDETDVNGQPILLPFVITYKIQSAPKPLAPSTAPLVWTTVAQDITTKEYTLASHPPGKYLLRFYAVAGGVESDESEHYELSVKPNKPRPKLKITLQSSTDLKTWNEFYVMEKDIPDGTRQFYRTGLEVLPGT